MIEEEPPKKQQQEEEEVEEEEELASLEWSSLDVKLRWTIVAFLIFLVTTTTLAQLYLPFYFHAKNANENPATDLGRRYALDLHEL